MSTVFASPPLQVSLRDVSSRPRFGCKGPAAEAFLCSLALPPPSRPNAWEIDASGRLVARLATTEFLVEDTGGDQTDTAAVMRGLLDPAQRRPGLVPFLRQDLVIELQGPRSNELLRQTCNVNFAPLARTAADAAGSLVLTSMIGVGVIVVPRLKAAETVFTIWVDPSYGHYVWSTLVDIAKELGGGILAGSGDVGATAPQRR